MKSIIQTEKECFICHCRTGLESHHCFGGANRKISEKYGLKVWLCGYDHRDNKNGVHNNADKMLRLKQQAQKTAMRHYNWTVQDFIRIIGKNYL